ncbi:MAG: stage V sporulation protein T, partial [Robinsoniella sp.]|nr:stage V sporulation protein T [Robinsoniella sp.]
AAGGMKKETVGKNISEELETIISDRRNVIISRAEGYVKLTQNDQEEGSGQVIWPIISEGDAIGAVVLIGREGRSMGETEKILAKCAAGFMGRQMES